MLFRSLPREVIGKVLFSAPYAGYIVSAAQKPVGFAIIIILPALFIAYDEIRKIKNEVKKMIKKKKAKDAQQDGEIDKVEKQVEELKEEVAELEHKKD